MDIGTSRFLLIIVFQFIRHLFIVILPIYQCGYLLLFTLPVFHHLHIQLSLFLILPALSHNIYKSKCLKLCWVSKSYFFVCMSTAIGDQSSSNQYSYSYIWPPLAILANRVLDVVTWVYVLSKVVYVWECVLCLSSGKSWIN